MKALLAVAILGGIGWVGYDHWVKEDPKVPAPVQVNINMPQPLGGTAPPGNQIYIP